MSDDNDNAIKIGDRVAVRLKVDGRVTAIVAETEIAVIRTDDYKFYSVPLSALTKVSEPLPAGVGTVIEFTLWRGEVPGTPLVAMRTHSGWRLAVNSGTVYTDQDFDTYAHPYSYKLIHSVS